RTLIVLAIAQLMGWGSVGLLAIVGSQIAADLQISIAAVFAGNSVFYVVMGLWAPPLAKAFNAFGARKVMILGTILAAPGFVVLAAAHGPVLYFTAWVILGTAGSAMLTTAAYIMLNEVAGSSAKSAIGVLMLMTGLSSSIFWPAAAFLSGLIGWRMTCLVYAAAMIVVCLPLHAFGLPRRQPSPKASSTVPATRKTPAVPAGIFRLIVSAITLNAFVTFGFSAI
ncbi:MAG: MFS transporter, partial [Mesorhizobium sp.]